MIIFLGICTPYATEFIKEEKKKATACIVTRSTNGMYEAKLGDVLTVSAWKDGLARV